MKKCKHYLLWAVLLWTMQLHVQAQLPGGMAMAELHKISQSYETAANLSFSVVYTFADEAHPNTPLEQLNGTYQFKSGRYHITLDDVQYIQGKSYHLTILRDDSMVVVNPIPLSSKSLQVLFNDSVFRNAGVDSIRVSPIAGGMQQIDCVFKPGLKYISYRIIYDPATYQLQETRFRIRNEDDNNSTGPYAIVTMQFSSYSTSAVDEAVVNDESYVYKTGNDFFARPPYSNYRLLVNVQ